VSQARRRPPRRNQPKRRSPAGNRNQRLLAILGVVVVISLIATIAGPPLIDYLTRPNDEDPATLDENSDDPVEQEYRTQIKVNPNDAAPLAGLANYLGNTGRVDEAIPLYEQSLELEPNNWATRLDFARALSSGGKRPDAELQFKKVLSACPGSEQSLFSLGQLYANWVPPRTADAIAVFEQAISSGPGTFVAERALEELSKLGVGSPVPASPVAVVEAGSPAADAEECP
jgi:tetratricopeptide (TPR) repeat protein